jgi:hypothetical protein
VPVWLDQQRLQLGENITRSLEGAVKESMFFISLISKHTERDRERYVHKERAWAAERHPDGFTFYLPLIIDDVPAPSLEPSRFSEVRRERLAPDTLGTFVRRVKSLVEQCRASGRPRS